MRVQLRGSREARLAQLEEAVSIAQKCRVGNAFYNFFNGRRRGGGNLIRVKVNSQQARDELSAHPMI